MASSLVSLLRSGGPSLSTAGDRSHDISEFTLPNNTLQRTWGSRCSHPGRWAWPLGSSTVDRP